MLHNLHRKGLPIPALETKADEYVAAGHLTRDDAGKMVETLRGERGKQSLINDAQDGDADPADGRGKISRKLTREEMQAELDERVEKMRAGAAGEGVADQYRVYEYIVGELVKNAKYLRLMVQASAGTGKEHFFCYGQAAPALAGGPANKCVEREARRWALGKHAPELPLDHRVPLVSSERKKSEGSCANWNCSG